jgi:hypothetical protein
VVDLERSGLILILSTGMARHRSRFAAVVGKQVVVEDQHELGQQSAGAGTTTCAVLRRSLAGYSVLACRPESGALGLVLR